MGKSSRRFAVDPAPDVRVHLTAGCPSAGCGRTDAHTHPQEEWAAQVDAADPFREKGSR